MNILFYGLFNKKFREVARKEFIRWFPKAAPELLKPLESKRFKAGQSIRQLFKSKTTNNENNVNIDPATNVSQISYNKNKDEQSIPLTADFAVDTCNIVEKCKLNYENPGPHIVRISVNSSSNKLLTDSSTQIPNSDYTAKLKDITLVERSNGENTTDQVENPCKDGSIKVTPPISHKALVEKECMNSENSAINTDFDKITKFPSPSKAIESEQICNSTPTKKVKGSFLVMTNYLLNIILSLYMLQYFNIPFCIDLYFVLGNTEAK